MVKSVSGKVGEGTGKGLETLKGVSGLMEKVSGMAHALAEQAETLTTMHDEARAALTRMQEWDKSLKSKLDKAHGFAVFPSIGRASLVVGVTYGKGEVFEQDRVIGYAGTVQLTLGVQLGGETLHELVIFEDKEALDRFKSGGVSFAANSSIALVKGAAAATNNPKGLRVFVYDQGGEMLEVADIGGQTFRFVPAPVAA
jgi:lipid-binding SYLF domain-containing protein